MHKTAEIQSCEVWRNDAFLCMELRPVPVLKDGESPFGPEAMFELQDGTTLHVTSSKVMLYLQDNTVFLWRSLDACITEIVTNKLPCDYCATQCGAMLRWHLTDHVAQLEIHGHQYCWSTPVVPKCNVTVAKQLR